jgi:hypothetical protein
MKKYLFILVFYPVLALSNELTETIRWHDPVMSSEFEQEMQVKGFEYNKDNDQYFYSAKDSKAINKVQDKILMDHSPVNAFWFKKREMFKMVRDRFISEGIKFSELNSDYGPVLAWDEADRKKARDIIADVANISF